MTATTFIISNIVAFFAGGLVSLVIFAALSAAKKADEQNERKDEE